MLCVLFTERYRSGHNGTVLKTVGVQALVGSNPTLSATFKGERAGHNQIDIVLTFALWRSTQEAEEAPLLRA